jgi:hypothetical protein
MENKPEDTFVTQFSRNANSAIDSTVPNAEVINNYYSQLGSLITVS